MRKTLPLFFTFVLLLVPWTARADHHLVFISKIIKISNKDCAVELTIFGNDQNGFETADNIKVDGTILVNLTALVDAGIDAVTGHNDSGDKILAGSNFFETAHGLNADLAFNDSGCANIDNNAVVSYSIVEGSVETQIDSVNAATVTGFGDNNTAITKASISATPVLVNLSSSTLMVGNNAGDTATLGMSGSSGSGGSGGCSLVPEVK